MDFFWVKWATGSTNMNGAIALYEQRCECLSYPSQALSNAIFLDFATSCIIV
jgi:hypothetical protein